MAPTKTRVAKKPMTQAHKDKLAEGRRQGRMIGAYLAALEANKPRRGRKVDASPKRIAQLDREIEGAFGLRKLELVQQKLELEQVAGNSSGGHDIEALRNDFVTVAKEYSTRKGISYAAWRLIGVPADALREADIER